MKTSLILFVCLIASTAADVSDLSKEYLPPKTAKVEKVQTESLNKYLPPKIETSVPASQNDEENYVDNESVNVEKENESSAIVESEDKPSAPPHVFEQAGFHQTHPKQSSALTETSVTTTTFIPCTSVNGSPCLPGGGGFYPGGNGPYPGGIPGMFPGNTPGFYPGYRPGGYPGSNFGAGQNYYPYPGQNFLNRPGQFGPNYPGSVGPQVFPGQFGPNALPGSFRPGPPGFLPGQNFAAGQNFEAGSNFVVGQNNLPGQGPFPGPNFYPRPPFAGNGFGYPMGGGFFTDNGREEEVIPESFLRLNSDTQYGHNGGYVYEKPISAAVL